MRKLTATLCLTLAMVLGSTRVSISADFQKGYDAYQRGNYLAAVSEWEPLAKQGDARAQNNLGFMYESGRGIPQNDEAAVRWYMHSAKQGNAFAQYNLGVSYDEGIRVIQNFKTAVKWYRLAAKQEHAGAQNNLGVMYQNGLGTGTPLDNKTAMKWYRLSAEQGNIPAHNNLGAMYTYGQGVPMDYVRAHMWFNIAASLGDKDEAPKNRDEVEKNMTAAQITKAQNVAIECVRKNYKGC